jgi:hypothetical protein
VSPSRALAVLLAIGCSMAPCAAIAATPVQFAVGFAGDARLGQETAMTLRLGVEHGLPPVTEFRLLTPAGLTLSDSRLGAASCRRPPVEILQVMGPVQQRRCPANSLLGTGTATADLLLSAEQTIFGAAKVELHAGGEIADKPGLLVSVDTYNPARMQLTYGGYLYVPPEPFGLGMAILVPAIPRPPFGAPVALSTLRLTVGRRSLTYYKMVHGRRTSYHPGGIPLPDACPRGGFRFRAILRFADASRRETDAIAPCPPAHARR